MTAFNFYDYKKCLNGFLSLPGTKGPRANLAQAIGCQPAYLSRVLNEDAHLSLEQAEAVCRHFVFNKAESSYFLALVGEERAGTEELRSYWREQKGRALSERLELQNRVHLNNRLSAEDQMVYFSSWHYAAIHAAVSVSRLQTVDSLIEFLRIEPDRVRTALRFLCATGLVEQAGTRFKVGETSLHVDKKSTLVAKHHLNWRIKGLEALNSPSPTDLHYTSLISIRPQDFDLIKETLLKAIENVRDLVNKSERPETLACYAIDLFELDFKEGVR